MERFNSRSQHLRKFIGTKESAFLKKRAQLPQELLGTQHGRQFTVRNTNMASVISFERSITPAISILKY